MDFNVYCICDYNGDHYNNCDKVHKLSYPVAVEVARYCVTVQQDWQLADTTPGVLHLSQCIVVLYALFWM